MAGEPRDRSSSLLGRGRERETLDRLLAEVLGGNARVLVVRGEPGVGKSALLGYLRDQVVGGRLLSAVGVEAEMELAYSGLHQLCAPLLDHLDALPVPQREALATIFGLRVGPAPDRFLVGLATLTLLAEVAEPHGLFCIVDDAQWLDQASAQVLGFVARRLLAERVALVCGARVGTGEPVLAGLPELRITGLDDEDARRLLLRNMHAPLDAVVREQVIAESNGNPLALLELPRAWTAADVAGGYGVPSTHAVAGKIEESYLRRLARLPADSQLLALAAAAEPLGNPVLLHRAADALGIDLDAAAPAADEGLFTVGRRVRFAHPLVRSAIYGAASRDDRRRAHGALAEATDAATDPDRRAWHRAHATSSPDEHVAVELERSASRAQSRGGLAAAAAFLSAATELTPDPVQRARRAVGAASANVQAGAFDAAQAMLTLAGNGPADELQRSMMDLVRAQLAFASSRGNEATALLLAAAQRLEPLNATLARETYLDAFSAAMFGARLNAAVGVAEVARAARAAAAGSGPVADRLLDALVALSADYTTAVRPCQEALRGLREDQTLPDDKLRWLWLGCVIALEVWDDESAYVLSDRHLDTARRTGALSELSLALSSRIPVRVLCGELGPATSMVAEAQSVEEMTGITSAPYAALIVGAWRGQIRETRRLIDSTLRQAVSRGEGVGVAICEYSRAVLCNAAGQYEQGAVAARSASEYGEVVAENWGLTELIEAAARCGRTELATEALNRLAVKAQASGTAWVRGIRARCSALLSDGDSAGELYREAIDQLGRTRVRAELARSHLLYGEWLRRANRRADARAELNYAYEMFNSMAMTAFAERAYRELLATGATVRKRQVENQLDLTAQEMQIARLARDGLSNPEIGAQLYISARTVEWHLRKIFAKLGVSSRRQLRGLLLDNAAAAFAGT
jgi:DNA-binding CsgD family transcriptional regulator